MRRKLLFASVAALAMVPLVLMAQSKSEPKEKSPPNVVAIALEKGGCHGDGPFCCASCTAELEGTLKKVPGVTKVTADTKAHEIKLEFAKRKLDLKQLVAATEKAGFGSPKL